MPEGVADPGVPGPAAAARPARGMVWPERVPWSELGPQFIQAWGRRQGGKHEPEHAEITGQTGSGKTYLLATLLQQRAAARGSSSVLVATKQTDATIQRLGWPVVDDWRGIKKNRQSIFWPHTHLQGDAREKYHEKRIYELLSRLWVPEANTVLALDEVAYAEDLSARVKKMIRMYWREARSQGITLLAMKQRPIGVVRDQHSESRWKFVFPPADRGDVERFAEMLGAPRDWVPVLDDLDQENHEFIIRNSVTKDAYISWIDVDLAPIPDQAHQPDRTAREYLFGRPQVG
jgi:hypothetical protein